MVNAKLNNKLLATVAGYITVYNYDSETREYISSSVEYLAVGVGIPANSCIDAPGEIKKGFAICRATDFSSWEYVTDHRGVTVYSTKTGSSNTVSTLGDYSKNTTILAPATPYDEWRGTEWVTNTDAQHAAKVTLEEEKKAALLAAAKASIQIWQTELQLGIISDDDKASLINWLAYIKALQVVNTDAVLDINWPTPPREPMAI